MSLALHENKDAVSTAAEHLEMRWLKYEGNWEEFVHETEERNNEYELEVLRLWPDEFRAAAEAQVQKIAQWEENRLVGLLENMHELATNAEKPTQRGGLVADNGTRFGATKFLIERVLGRAPEADKPKGNLARALDDRLQRRAELKGMLESRGLKITETTVTREVEVDERAAE